MINIDTRITLFVISFIMRYQIDYDEFYLMVKQTSDVAFEKVRSKI